MIAYNSNEGSRHTGVVWLLWYAADSAYALGQLVAIDYSDATPDVAFTYDRLGRQLTITDVLGTRTNVYSPTDLLEERHPDGTALVRSYDPYGRAAGIALGTDYAVGYGYDEFGRFSTVAVSNGATFTYSYVPDSSLLSGYTNDLGLAVAYEYEPHRDLKTLVSNAWGTNTISTFAYTYDEVGRRTQRIDVSSTTNLFGYNLRSELISAEMGTNTYAYAYDPIGNRTSTSENGTTTTYAANSLNQYTALNPSSTNPTPFTYDPDGNMTSDGTWSCTWDAENRLIEVQPLATNLGSALVQYMYDFQSRRIARREFAWNDYLGETTWHYVQGRAFRYDDWNLLQEQKPAIVPRTPHPYIFQTDLALTGIGGPVSAAYVWGLDLSGTLQGAGGIGGLLMQHHSDTNSSWVSFCDANGNITDLLDEDGSPSAHYEYDSHGNTTSMLCEQGDTNPFRFSSKYHDDETGLYYYGFRFYSSQVGRWLNRDPIVEKGERNIYGHTANNPMNRFDVMGLISANEKRNYQDCIQAKQNMENGVTTGNQWLDYYATEMKKLGCKYKIECHQCSRGLKPPMGSAGTAEPKGWFKGCFYPTFGTCVARIAIDAGGTLETVVHEMTHCMQFCTNVPDRGCKGCLCTEIQANYRANPSMPNSDLLRKAIYSCSGDGDACEKVELKNVRAMMTEEVINECKGLSSPP